MILRRITQHVKAQNWFAVGLDFVIVVVGVFIGIQVANWNAGRANHNSYLQALNRMAAEIDDNLANIDEGDRAINESVSIARKGLDALVTCAEGAEAIDAVNASIVVARGTRSVQLRSTALTELTENPVLLSEQSESMRERLSALRFFMELSYETSTQYAPNPLESWPADTATLRIDSAEPYSGLWFGIEYDVLRYPIVLSVDMEQACTDIELQQWLHRWEYWQGNILIFHKKLRQEFQETTALLKATKR